MRDASDRDIEDEIYKVLSVCVGKEYKPPRRKETQREEKKVPVTSGRISGSPDDR